MARVFLGVMMAVALASSLGTAQADCLFKEYDINDLASILRSEGYGSIQVGEDRIQFEVKGLPYLLTLMDDGDLQMFCGFAGARLAFEDINEWNQRTRLNTAYIDEERDPVMTADLLANAGINEAIFKEFVAVFVHSFGPEFRRFVNERNRAR